MNYENFVNAIEGLTDKYARTNPDVYVCVNRTNHGLEVACRPRKEMRDRWVKQMLAEYEEDFAYWSEIILIDPDRKIVVVHFEDDWNSGETTYALCSPTDKFDKDVGLAVAFAKFRGYAIPDFV